MLKLDTSAAGFSLTNARALVRVAAQAYAQRSMRDPVSGTDVLLLEQEDAVILAFRGTSEPKDFITDARFGRVEVHGGEVHRGFWNAWLGIRERLWIALLATAADKPLFITGHSLGGALAILAAQYFAARGRTIAGVYTYGAPRVGDRRFCETYDGLLRAATFQVVAQGDPVPLVPTLLMGYRDCGHEIFIRNDGAVQFDPFIGTEIFADVLGAVARWRERRLGLLPNHFVAHYDERITALYDAHFNDDTTAADFQTP